MERSLTEVDRAMRDHCSSRARNATVGLSRTHGASLPHHPANGVITYVKDSEKPVSLTLTVPAAGPDRPGPGNPGSRPQQRVTASGDESSFASLVRRPATGGPGFNLVEALTGDRRSAQTGRGVRQNRARTDGYVIRIRLHRSHRSARHEATDTMGSD